MARAIETIRKLDAEPIQRIVDGIFGPSNVPAVGPPGDDMTAVAEDYKVRSANCITMFGKCDEQR